MRIIFLTAMLVFTMIAKSQTDYLQKITELPQHPRLLMLKGDEIKIKRDLASNMALAKVHEQILNESNAMLLLKPIQNIKIGKRLLDKSREALRRIYYLSYAWRMTNDDKYLKKGEEELLNVCSFSDWNPSHFLDVAEMTMGVAIGYDWLYDGLSVSAKNVIKQAILEKGLTPSLDAKNTWWLKSSTNWNQVCNAGISFGAIAIFEDNPNQNKFIIKRSLNSIQLSMKDYGPDGAYAEGYGYWDYGTSFNVMFLDAIEKLFHQYFGLNDVAGFKQTPYYFQNMTAPSGDGFNFSDSGLKGELQPALFWFSKLLNDPSLLWGQYQLLANINGKELTQNRLLPSVVIWNNGLNQVLLKAPKQLMWAGSGKTPVALMRTSWTDAKAIYVAIKGGSPSTNHAHMDVGSFVLEADGIRWAMDFGSEKYEKIEAQGVDLWNNKQNSQRWQIFRYNNKAHNTLTINDSLQRVDGKAAILSSSNAPTFMNAIVDLKDIYRNNVVAANRGIAIVDSAYVVVRDEIESDSLPISVRWNMLTPATVKLISNNKAELTKNGQKLIVEIKDTDDVILKTWSTKSDKDYESDNSGTVFIGFETVIPAKTKKSITVLLIPSKNENKVTKKLLPLAKWPIN